LSGKGALAIIGGSSLTFLVVVGIMFASIDLDDRSPTRGTGGKSQFRPPPVFEKTTPATPSITNSDASLGDLPNTRTDSIITKLAFPEKQMDETLETTARARKKISATASKHLSKIKADLKQQIVELKKNRDQMLNDFSNELMPMTPEKAADQIASLDEKSAREVLSKLPESKRELIREAINSKGKNISD
tara:strand:+ start:45 stop:614 length:570 start_codon:yes stop_codon:yes gene_type:complete